MARRIKQRREIPTFGQELKEAREALGLTQEEFGDAVDISQSAVSQLESGKNEAAVGTKFKIFEFLSARADFLKERGLDYRTAISLNMKKDAPEVYESLQKVLRDQARAVAEHLIDEIGASRVITLAFVPPDELSNWIDTHEEANYREEQAYQLSKDLSLGPSPKKKPESE